MKMNLIKNFLIGSSRLYECDWVYIINFRKFIIIIKSKKKRDTFSSTKIYIKQNYRSHRQIVIHKFTRHTSVRMHQKD